MTFLTSSILVLGGLTLAGVAPSQQKEPPPPPARPAPTTPPATDPRPMAGASTFAALSDWKGAEVICSAAAGPAPKEGDKAKDGEIKKGRVTDLVINTLNGQIACMAVEVKKEGADRTVLVPASALKFGWVDKKPTFNMTLGHAEVMALPEFEGRKLDKGSLDRAVELSRGGKPMEAGAPVGEDAASKHALASELKGSEVNASDKEAGNVHDAAVNTGTNTLAYLIISRGGAAGIGSSHYIVPFSAVRWTRTDEKSSVKVSMTADQLKGAPEYKKPDQGYLSPDQARSADAFFGGAKPVPTPPANPQ